VWYKGRELEEEDGGEERRKMKGGGRIRKEEMRKEKGIRSLEKEEEERRDETKQCKKSRVDPPLFCSQLFLKTVDFFFLNPPNINSFS
jgi:hypothetical protein